MLPSMPLLFNRDTLDTFGCKEEPSTSFFSQNFLQNPLINPEPPPLKSVSLPLLKDFKGRGNSKNKAQDNNLDIKALESALVKSYYKKVQSRFASHQNVPTNKFVMFKNLLKFHDPSKDTPVNLFKKVEELFGDEHKDIVEEFLLFLKPEQAMEVGRFMDQFLLMQMTNFIELLQTAFARKPTVLRKVLRAMTSSINSGSSEQMKARILPHLRSHPKLIVLYKSMFPDERPPERLYGNSCEMLKESSLNNDNQCEFWEYEDESDKKKLEVKEKPDTMYTHGRVFLQYGRMLRSARITYPYSKEPYRVHLRRLAPSQQHLSPTTSDEEQSPKRPTNKHSKITPKKVRKPIKSPIKNIKDVNDNTKVKETSNQHTSSPKPKKSQTNKSKLCKDKKDDSKVQETLQKNIKKEKPDCKNSQSEKNKDECSKPKVSKINIIQSEATMTEINVDSSNLFKTDLDVKINTVKSEIKNQSTQIITESETDETNIDIEVINDDNNTSEMKDWTREEDKTMLQILKGEAGSESVFLRIRELLPHRSANEIKERFCHVMTLLQQMAVGEVT